MNTKALLKVSLLIIDSFLNFLWKLYMKTFGGAENFLISANVQIILIKCFNILISILKQLKKNYWKD